MRKKLDTQGIMISMRKAGILWGCSECLLVSTNTCRSVILTSEKQYKDIIFHISCQSFCAI